MAPRFKVRFGDVETGWTSVCFQLGDTDLREYFSYTPNDALAELADAGSGLLEGARTHTATLHLEPAELELQFRPTVNGIEVTVAIWPDDRRSNVEPDILYCEIHGPGAIATAMWRGLRELESRWEACGYTGHWRGAFPSDAVARLRMAIDRHKGAA